MSANVEQRADPALAEIVSILVDLMDPERIYLFGSHARGNATMDSDYDLLVLVPAKEDTQHNRIDRAYDALWGIPVPVDIIVQTMEHFDSRSHLKASLAGTVLREGKLLYASE